LFDNLNTMANYVVGLDIGTKFIKTALVEISRHTSKPKLITLFSFPSAGLQKGVVVDEEEACSAVSIALEEVRKFAKKAPKNTYINIGGKQTSCQVSKAMVPLPKSDSRVSFEDVERVTKAAEAMVRLGSNRMIIHTVTRDFAIDGIGDISDPVGLNGAQLEANCLIIDAFYPNVRKAIACVEKSGGTVSGPIYGPLAASRAVLNRSQKDLGVALIDIGAGTTGLAVYEEQKLLHTAILPVGSLNITNDIALGLKIPVSEAESVKLSFGYALSREIPAKETVEVNISHGKKVAVSRRFLSEIVEVRLAEIFELVNEELKRIQRLGQLPGGAVLVGGGARLPGIVELAKRELKLPAQIGLVSPELFETDDAETAARIEDPDYAVALGLTLFGVDENSKVLGSLADWLRSFMP
jgi:cell division protein FtsA